MKANQSGQSLNSSSPIRLPGFLASATLAMLISSAFCVLPERLIAQTTDFVTKEKTKTLPPGTRIDPKSLLRRPKKIQEDETDDSEKVSPETEKQDRLEEKLNERLLGGWALVSTVDKKITADSIATAVQRCLKQLTLKPLAFDPAAEQRIPDIDALYGDVIYYRTEKGLQRMDLNLGQIMLLNDVSIAEGANAKPYWSVRNDNVIFRIRFSNALPMAPKANFMLENLGFYVHCGRQNKDKFVQ
ncbi:MAG: hypothetical protein ACR2O8_04655 [Rhizobiaceae bacterium]